MAFMNWSDNFAVNIKEVDNQHRKLLGLVNQLFDAMSVGKGKDVLGTVLTELINYTVYHFSTEERLFKQYGYPEFEKHKKEHDDLTRQATELKEAFDSGNKLITIDVMNFLRDWLNVHILQEDRKFGPFLNKKGVE